MSETKGPLPHKHIGVAVIWNDQDEILIDRRKQEGLLGGLWEFPGGKIEPEETVEACIRREIQEELGIQVEVGGFAGDCHPYLFPLQGDPQRSSLHPYQRRATAHRMRRDPLGHPGHD
jgi:8-oxo-dGTP pyrophosphatase MutT (NUDIX family)